MDNTTRFIAEFAAAQRYETISPDAVAATIRHHLDGIGCAAGGFASEPCHVTRRLAAAVSDGNGASVFGVPHKTTPEYATFANASAVRHLDFNDTYLGGKGGGGHPNDMAPAIFAAVEMVGGSGCDLINGLYIAYEVFGGLSNAIRFRGKGIDQGISVSLGTAAAVARILGLNAEGIANAIAMAIVPSIPVRVTRATPPQSGNVCLGPRYNPKKRNDQVSKKEQWAFLRWRGAGSWELIGARRANRC